MAGTVIMPKLGFDMAEGKLVKWVAAEGDQVKKGSILAEIETDKATVEVESTLEGVLLRHLAVEGGLVPVGEPIAAVGKPGEVFDAPVLEKAAPSGSASVTAENLAVPPPAAAASPTQPAAAAPTQPAAARPTQLADQIVEGRLPGGLRASPVARRIADEGGIDLNQVKGSGPGGRIVKKDLQGAPPAAAPAPLAAGPQIAASLPLWQPAGAPPADQVIPLPRLRLAIGRRMQQSKQQAPHFYVTHEYDMAGVLDLRAQVNKLLAEGEKLSVNDFVIKAVALTLRQFPNLNAVLDGEKIIRRGPINIGSAVAVEGGLLTVVCHEADRKPIRQISLEVRAMAERARQGKIHPGDVEGSTFSISNLGMYTVENFIAILNPPEAAILAVATARDVPVVVDGQIRPGVRMKATISVDHRISDGAEAARFMQALAQYLEEPLKLLL
jgi:pyruvate dehydrogenase E2 component (dihydrolipoamide acetyltransferase)